MLAVDWAWGACQGWLRVESSWGGQALLRIFSHVYKCNYQFYYNQDDFIDYFCTCGSICREQCGIYQLWERNCGTLDLAPGSCLEDFLRCFICLLILMCFALGEGWMCSWADFTRPRGFWGGKEAILTFCKDRGGDPFFIWGRGWGYLWYLWGSGWV